MKVLLEILQVIQLAIKLYKKAGYERARQQLLEIVEEKNDKKTADYVSRIIHDDEL
jgi:ribosomal protein S18 acetylase RimI-like enzyme